MGFYSEKTQRAFDKYINRLVRRMPVWLRHHFNEERICFVMNDKGILELFVDETLPDREKTNAQALISKYMEKNKSEVVITADLN